MPLTLPIEQVVYVPSTNKSQKQISSAEMSKRAKEVEGFLSKKYGGFTAVAGTGGYTLDSGGLVTEGVVKVTGFTTKEKHKQLKPALVKQLSSWGKKWGQESMGLEIEGDLYYVDTNSKKAVKKIPVAPIKLKHMLASHSPSWFSKETIWSTK